MMSTEKILTFVPRVSLLCCRSKLYVDGPLLVNDDGLHGMVEKCGGIDLTSGPHVVYIEGFQAGGGVGMVATFSGPDTGGKKVLMKSGTVFGGGGGGGGGGSSGGGSYFGQCNPTAQQDPSQFTICMFRSNAGLRSIPKLSIADSGASPLRFVGKGRLQVIDLRDLRQFRAAVSGTPDANYAWAIYGQLRIGTAGRYTLCITSDDGYSDPLYPAFQTRWSNIDI